VVSLGRGCNFRPPPPPPSSKGDFLHCEIDFFPRFIIPPLLWDVEEMYGTTKWPYQFLGVVGTIEIDDFI
jgi:hypothetical protein